MIESARSFSDMERREWRFGEVTGTIVRCFYSVYDGLGYGFLESVYCTGLEHELRDAGLHLQREASIDVWLKGRKVGHFRADFIVERCVVVEVKAARHMDESDRKQLLNYLRATDLEVGLLLHFGPKAEFRRIEVENEKKPNLRLSEVVPPRPAVIPPGPPAAFDSGSD